MKDDIGVEREGNGATSQQLQRAFVADALHVARDRVRVDRLRFGPLEAQQDRRVRAMAFAGRAERPEELRRHALDRREPAFVVERQGEAARGAHRPEGVRTGGPDADGEEIERREAHTSRS